MKEYYEIEIEGLKRHLPLCPLNDKLKIGAFVIFGDVELTEAAAAGLLRIAPTDYDYMITAESKGIPLVYEMARQSGKPYVVARKSVKLYMTDPISVKVKSITTAAEQTLYLSAEKAAIIRGKRVLIADDVISTGESLKSMETLVNQVNGNIVGRMAVLAEGDSADRDDITFLEKLPLFNPDGTIKED
jgi:adenine phosphoribosyltransferase